MSTKGVVLTTDFADLTTAQRVVSIANTWIGTPYHHQASVKGVGCDCLGLVRGVYAELYGKPAETPPPYTRDLAEATGRETLLEAARRHLIEVTMLASVTWDEMLPGDVVVFRIKPSAKAKHCAILTSIPGIVSVSAVRMIHAFESGPVCEVDVSPWWSRRIVAVFRFPERDK
jgi:NlpC/P60 family putative phage cell wall peptidase